MHRTQSATTAEIYLVYNTLSYVAAAMQYTGKAKLHQVDVDFTCC